MEKGTNNSNEHNAESLYIGKFLYKIIFKFFYFQVAKTRFYGLPI